jgi:hypothetical protein
MHRLGLLVVLVGCNQSEPKDSPESAPPKVAKVEAPTYADVKGVVVTAGDIRFNGKGIGVLGERLLTDRSVLVGQIREALGMGEKPKETLVISYTDDAPAAVVLAGIRAIAEATKRPPADEPPPPDDKAANESGGTGTAMALDEGKMGSKAQLARQEAIDQARTAGILGSKALTAGFGGSGEAYKLVALSGSDGKPHVVCEPRAWLVGTTDNEVVKLVVTFGANDWKTDITRVNESTSIASIDALSKKLRDEKASALFSDRTDIELLAKAGATGAQLTPIVAAACSTGFVAIQSITADELAKQEAADPIPVGPQISIGQPNAQGDLDKKLIRSAVKHERDKLLACYADAVAKQPTLRGTVSAGFVIGADGHVTLSDASGVDPAVAKCVAGVFKNIAFDKPTSGVVQVNYPVTFAPGARP